MRKDAVAVATEIARLTGLPLVAFESYADGQVSDPTTVHVAASLPRGRYLDAHGVRDLAQVVSGLFGATFGTRPLDEAGALALAGTAHGAEPDAEATSSLAEVVVEVAGFSLPRDEDAPSPGPRR